MQKRAIGELRGLGTRLHLGETLAAAGHVPPRFWEVNLIVTVRGVGKERVCSVLKLQHWVMKFTVNLQQEIVKRTLKLIFYIVTFYSIIWCRVTIQASWIRFHYRLAKESTLAACAAWQY